eukprot:TRINITY_DN7322_c0_g1_i1.p1 TRINITY_DN7322_c0_g1~~TRINITY_DN7322_c0_g1_i1.p1  ORF type:complete len:257 (-),score=23.34 TRINITY_DN7322_c0_g1_i1:270-1040(-)
MCFAWSLCKQLSKKQYDYSYAAILQQLRESCLRMGVNKVDALAIHDLDAMFGGDELVNKYLEHLGKGGGMKALRELKERGAIKAVGIGCNPYKFGSLRVCEEVAQLGGLDYILLAGPYNLLNQEALDNLLPLCKAKNISVIAGAPYASGILVTGTRTTKKPRYMYEPASEDMLAKVRKIEAVCDMFSVKLPDAALQFPLFHPRVASVLSGAKSVDEVRMAVASMSAIIPAGFWKELRTQGLIRADAPICGDDVGHL